MRYIGVLAATKREFDEWVARNPAAKRRAIWLHDRRSCWGIHLSEIVRVNAWYRMPDAKNIEIEAETRLRP